MFAKVVVGIDGRPGGEDAFALAEALACPGALLILANAYPYDAHLGQAPLLAIEQDLRADSLELLHRTAGTHDRVALRAIADPSPARALHHLAEEVGADLIVVGSCHHHHAIGRVLLGDVSRATLHGASVPVAVAPRGFADGYITVHTIGVGFDRTPESQLALELGRDIAAGRDGTLRVRTVTTPPVAFSPGYVYAHDVAGLEEELEKSARADLVEATANLGVPVITEVSSGLPSQGLENLSQVVDLLVVGSRGRGPIHRVVLGSTTDRLAHTSHSPLVVVPRPARDRLVRPAPAMSA